MINNDQLINSPIFVAVVWQVAADDDGYLALFEFFHGNLQRICVPLQLHHDWCTHGDLQGSCTQHSCSFVPSTTLCDNTWQFARLSYPTLVLARTQHNRTLCVTIHWNLQGSRTQHTCSLISSTTLYVTILGKMQKRQSMYSFR